MLWDKHQKQIEAISRETFDKAQFLNTRLEQFIGTYKELEEYRSKIVQEAKDIAREIARKYNDSFQKIFEAYKDELATCYTVPKPVFLIAYSIAHEHGHSAGHANVERILEDIIDDIAKVYMHGYTDGLKNRSLE